MTSASAVSRTLRATGIMTTTSYLREGVRVRRGALKGTASVRAEFDSPNMAQRRARQIADVLRDKGFVVDMHTDSQGMTVSK